MTLTGIERISNILQHKPVDRIGLFEHFWSDTQKVWTEQGYIRPEENLADHFGFDIELCWPFNVVADLDFVPEILEETAETVLTKDGNGAILRRHKLHDATPEHVDFTVKDRAGWEEQIKPRLKPERRRINFAAYREAKERARQAGRFFMWSGVNVFEIMKDVVGHVYMLEGMALDPTWVLDMAMTYAQLTVDLQEILFAEEGWPDGLWYYEDMGFKQHPFMSPRMYRQIVQPAHTLSIGYAKAHGKPVVMHSCGYVEPLLPGMIEAGIDCLQVIEVKAGMDLLKLYQNFGDRLAFMGGIDVRTLYTNDRAVIDAELEAKIPTVMQNYGYVLHSDHSIPNTVYYDTYRYFIEKGLALGTYQESISAG
ncbi:MAG TPA: uroporphyrinogen decarboxylase family protein [Anaerolineae bacterium]|nr:uroporphyrinogen decarboxylase family protein [Anaerolineae bacterium]HQH39407.1 uroporphyrinogen decarboxylase family protein [Anaerolineae bacterium]